MAGGGSGYRHWRIEQGDEGVIFLTIDRSDSGANSLSGEILQELDRLLDELDCAAARGVVFRSGKKNGFIAGADIREFTALGDEAAALWFIRRGQGVLSRIESLPVPTVALIHGFCLGGGLELALACRYRIASDDPATMLGFPEVRLGLHPGFGGTVRSTRLVGPLSAMKMMLTGNPCNARQSLRIGLVDSVVPRGDLERAALAMIAAAPSARSLPRREQRAELPQLKPRVAAHMLRRAAMKADPRHYPAPSAMISLWSGFGSDDDVNYSAEAESIARLMVGNTARNLIRVFLLQERLKALGRGAARPPETVHLVGCGSRGADIAAWSALNGLRVTIQDRDGSSIEQAVKSAEILFTRHLRNKGSMEAALDRLVPDPAGRWLAQADVVIEAISENADQKRELYCRLEQGMRPDAVLAHNGSGITLEELAGCLARPERLVGLHFQDLPGRHQLVEVATMAGTDPNAMSRATALVLAVKRLPLPVASSPGLLVNRILMPYLLEAVRLVEEGVSPGEVDRAAIDFGMPAGPLRLVDEVGLDACLGLARILSGRFSMEMPPMLERLVAAGRLGRKCGMGFYSYPAPIAPETTVSSACPPAAEIGDRIMLRLLNEAVACRRERLVGDDDLLDAGVIFGSGFAPFRGGPLQHILTVGPETLLERLRELKRQYGNRFSPDPGWQDLIGRQRPIKAGG